MYTFFLSLCFFSRPTQCRLIEQNGFSAPRKGKNNDKAHPPIHPVKDGSDLQNEERAVYEIVARRFLACCSKNAKGQETNIEIEISAEIFSSKGINRKKIFFFFS